MPRINYIFICGLLLLCGRLSYGQSTTMINQIDQIIAFPDKLTVSLQEQSGKAKKRLQQQSCKYLARLKKQEKRLYKGFVKKDSIQVKNLFGNIDSIYTQLESDLLDNDSTSLAILPNNYSGRLDSMQMAFRFLESSQNLSITNTGQYQKLLSQYAKIQGNLNQSERVSSLILERKRQLVEQLSNSGLSRKLMRYQKQVYYYQEQLKQYRAALENPQLLERKALELLSNIPAFRKYFDKFSQLGSMFRLPGQLEDMDPSELLAGLQVRDQVLNELASRFGGTASAQQAMNNGLQQGQSELYQLKQKLTSALNSGELIEMPGFKPNVQKGKSFLKRLELGTNMQSQRANGYFPSSSDLGLSVGYKLNSTSILGVGISYKVGWGENIRKIRITHEGIGLRSFLDWRIKGKIWATGGWEWNYRSRFDNLTVIKEISQWKQSALLGLQVKQPVGKYKTTVSLMYDALWKQHVPATQPILFRVGYLLK